MIVRQFLQWLRHAPASDRAEATSALARAYLYSDLSEHDHAAAESAMLLLLDDPSPLVRRSLAEALAPSEFAPPIVIHALAADQPDVAAPLFERSPLFLDADLIDAVATGESRRQVAIARRPYLPASVSAAIAEVGCAEACLVLLENPGAELVSFSLDRIVDRHGHLPVIRDVLLQRGDLSAPTHQKLVAKLAHTLAEFVVSRAWLAEDRAREVAKDACERATIALAAESAEAEVGSLIRHLRESGQLTGGLMLRALLCGNLKMFEEALAELTGMPIARVSGIVHDRRGAGFRALYDKAGLPPSTYTAFREALNAIREAGFVDDMGGASRLKRRIVERVLTCCEEGVIGDVEPLLTLLRRFAAEAAREEARLLCDELTSDAGIDTGYDMRPAAA